VEATGPDPQGIGREAIERSRRSRSWPAGGAASPGSRGRSASVSGRVVFAIVFATTLLITYWASKRTHSATEFWAANRGISGLQNGFAIAGDYLSASTFLGFAGLI
jgi:hypothetical protein